MKHANISIFIPHEGCPHQCSFCNQRSITGKQKAPSGAEAAVLCKEALQHSPQGAEIAFFGGSFTAIPKEYMVELLTAVQPYIAEEKFHGIRISTRPDAISEDILRLLESYHVTSIELGVQSLDNNILQMNRRGHTASDVENAVKLIRRHSFELGLQFMPGLYGDTEESILSTAKAIVELKPDTVRIYPTLVLEGTELAELYSTGAYTPLTLVRAIELSATCMELFEEHKIRVIRVGLHAAETMEAQLLAGPYHPAFRELCESFLFYKKALAELSGRDQNKAYHLFTAPKALSQMIGQNRNNLEKLKKQGWNIKIKADDTLSGRDIIIKEFIREGQK